MILMFFYSLVVREILKHFRDEDLINEGTVDPTVDGGESLSDLGKEPTTDTKTTTKAVKA